MDMPLLLNSSCLFDRPAKITPPYYWIEHIPFANFLVNSLEPTTIVELGVQSGNSFNAFCHAVKAAGLGTQCYGIDTWKGDEHTGQYGEGIYNELSDHVSDSYQGFASLLRMTFDDGLKSFQDGSVDLLHIDGFHTYEAVKHDFENWLPKMSDVGVVLLHDIAVREGNFGVWRFWDEISGRYPSLAFSHGSGLGVVAIGPRVAPEFLDALCIIDASPFYRQLFARLGKYIWLQEKNREGDANEHSQMDSREGKRGHRCSLYVDTGTGFNEAHRLTRDLEKNEVTIEFDVSAYRNIRQMMLRLSERHTAVRIGDINVHCEGGALLEIRDYRTNAASIEGTTHLFLTDDPQLTFPVDGQAKPRLLKIEVQYLTVCDEAVGEVLARIHVKLEQMQRRAEQQRPILETRILAQRANKIASRFLKAVRK